MSYSNKNVATGIRMMRARADITQGELAERAGINIGTVAAYESGEMCPGADKIMKMSEALGCTPNDLLGWGSPERKAVGA